MSTAGWRVVLGAWALVWMAPPTRGAVPLAEKLPETTLVYVGWAGRSLTFDGSAFGQMVSEGEVKRLFAAARGAIASPLAEDADAQALLEEVWSLASMGWQRPAAVALFGVARSAGRALPTGAVLIDLHGKRAEFDRRFQAMLAAARKKFKIAPAAGGGGTYHRFETPFGPVGTGFAGDIFFVAMGPGAPETVLSLAAGKAKSLAGNAGFADAMKGVCGEHVQIAFYADWARLLGALDPQPAPGPATAPARPGKLRQIVEALGLGRASALAGAASIVDKGLYEKVRILSPEKHAGLLKLLAGGALPATALAGVPGDAELALSVRVNAAEALGEVLDMVEGADPPAGRRLREALDRMHKDVGVDVTRELLGRVGETWTLLSASSLGGFGTGTLLTAPVADEAKFKAALTKFEVGLKKHLCRPPGPGRAARGYDVLAVHSNGVAVHYVAAAGRARPLPVAPAWAVHKGRLYLAAFPQVILAATAPAGGKPLTEQPAFAALRKRVGAKPSVLLYVNTPRLLRQLYGLLLAGWTVQGNALAGQIGPAFNPGTLPTLPTLRRYARAQIAAVSADARGITIESYGSLPAGGLFLAGLPSPALAAAAPLTAIRRACAEAGRAASRKHLLAIGKACRAYATDHKSQFPPDLLRLVDSGLIDAKVLICPTVARSPARAGPTTRPVDYVYLGAMMTADSPGEMVLAHERPEVNANQGTHVLGVDGSVRWVGMEPFRRALARTRAYLDGQGK